ncbi:F0F1 ATP synthase subunit gamma [Variovorax ureilyticus]|uniref:F0F1 ATP synthase subunit gamma n=1 Tax=Variovorax ureilyticus TaxID=1836198 RepID=A0ABU8VMY6_9BURK
MSNSTAGLRRQIDSAADLQSVVRTMKAIAASSIGQYERSVRALVDYKRTVDLGLGACLRTLGSSASRATRRTSATRRVVSVVVFGSDQGLVGRFNEAVADHAIATLGSLPDVPRVFAVGERVHALLVDAGLAPVGRFAVPTSVNAIPPLVGQILVDSQRAGRHEADSQLHLIYNSPASAAAYRTVSKQLLPLDEGWRRTCIETPWPTKNLPEVMGGAAVTLAALVGEYLFVSLFRACAESLASENSSRLAAMERADKNIDELLVDLRGSFHRLRQDGIDEELFDVISGFEALNRPRQRPKGQGAPP